MIAFPFSLLFLPPIIFQAKFLGEGDLHDSTYDDLEEIIEIFEVPEFTEQQIQDGAYDKVCGWDLHVYPSKIFEQEFASNLPTIFAILVAGIFLFVVLVFFMYNYAQEARNDVVVSTAAQSNAIVSSMIPEHLRARLMDENEQSNKKNSNLKAFLNTGEHRGADGLEGISSKPLADLFLETTVLFADISGKPGLWKIRPHNHIEYTWTQPLTVCLYLGFTAWSSVREPTQVFLLLETLYQSFDALAKQRKVFKVETVGDCYVGKSVTTAWLQRSAPWL